MSGNQIRSSFLDYFTKNGHTVVKSSPLVPEKDPTLLFTNAGMVQFKNIFLGLERLPYVRAASSQKCLRISGKHNDLEAVGQDTYHHTFFEMLGNWSFGDYHKAEAIALAWDLLTREWGLPKERLWATVFREDDETEQLWYKLSGLPSGRILRFGEDENFWEMGETGPCGPCSEIHIERGVEACDRKGEKGHRCQVNGGCSRFIELWNLVFIQHNRNEDGKLEDLPSKHVDTGMGLERITAVLQGVLSNYDVDLLHDLIAATEGLAGKKYGENPESDTSFRVIADHARAVTFLIADGVPPSNDGRGYVLRRLLRRAARHGQMIGLKEPFLHRLVDTVFRLMGEAYPELRSEKMRIRDVIQNEEERFAQTLDKGLVHLEEALGELGRRKKKVLPGETAFRLYDTYGFPLDLTEDILRGKGISVDHAGFERFMEEQRNRARVARESLQGGVQIQLDQETRFVGYDRIDLESRVIAIYSEGQGREEAGEGAQVDLITSETPFYGESGGQVGDRGAIETPRGDQMEVADTQHLTPQVTVHKGWVTKGRIQLGDKVYLRVDPDYRRRTMLNHSATHILHSVLREELGPNVRQAGSLVTPDRLRFDFTYRGPIPQERLSEIESRVNERVRLDAEVRIDETDYQEAIRKGALAFFGEKYGVRVRVVRIGDFSVELCGGTHVCRSGEIGLFKLHAEGGVSAGVRRVEAVTGDGALDLIRTYEQILKEIRELLRGSTEETVEKVKKLLEHQRGLEKEVEHLRAQARRDQIPDLLARRKNIDGTSVLITEVEKVDAKQLREIADQLRDRMGSGVVILLSPGEKNVHVVSSVSQDLTHRYHAGDIVKQLAMVVGGGGGGRPDFAQAGGKDPLKVPDALKKAEELVRLAK
ncbi:MAG: alanine--tRNA ligase [Candidatus Binatia bacterium]